MTQSPSERRDIPPELAKRAAEVGPSLLAWLEAAYPTDAEHAAAQRRKRHQEKQLALPLTDRSAA